MACEKVCPSCGFEISGDVETCDVCGTKMESKAAAEGNDEGKEEGGS